MQQLFGRRWQWSVGMGDDPVKSNSYPRQRFGITRDCLHSPFALVRVKDPNSKFSPQAFLCTEPNATPEQMPCWFRQRWQLELTFVGSACSLGCWDSTSVIRPCHLANNTCFVRDILTGELERWSPVLRSPPTSVSLVCETLPNVCWCPCISPLPSLEATTFETSASSTKDGN
jgi:hypothetical protein